MGALSCCACKTWRRWRLRAVVRAVMLSDCCAGAPCRDMGSCAGRLVARESGRGGARCAGIADRVNEKAASGLAGWCAATPTRNALIS